MPFYFNEPENVASFTCRHVLEEGADICYVTHDEEDGAWQFLCGASHSAADGRIVSLQGMLELDASLAALAGMPLGCGAQRAGKGTPWKGFKQSC